MMMRRNENGNGEDKGFLRERLLLIVFVTLLGTGGGVGGNRIATMYDPPRPDPFTGEDGRKLQFELNVMKEKIVEIKEELEQLPPEWLKRQVDELTQRVVAMERAMYFSTRGAGE
jgi:hypothetical protein